MRCCIAEPQVIVVWPAGADEPEITGDVRSLIAHAAAAPRARLRHLARARQGAGDGGGGRRAAHRGQGLLADADDAAAAPRRGRRPRHRRARGAAHQGPDRRRRASSPSSPPIISSCAATSTRSGGLLEALPAPVWARDATGRLTWVNAAYARAVEARDGARCGRAQSRNSRSARRATTCARARAPGEFFEARLPVIVAGTRRILQVIDRAVAGRQRRHRHRRHRSRGDARRTRPHDRGAPPHARPARDRGRDLLGRPAARRSTTPPTACCGGSSRRSSIPSRPTRRCSTACARRASFPSRPTSATGRPNCTKPTARSSRASTNGICPTGARCASSPRRTRKAASPICSTT